MTGTGLARRALLVTGLVVAAACIASATAAPFEDIAATGNVTTPTGNATMNVTPTETTPATSTPTPLPEIVVVGALCITGLLIALKRRR